MFFTRMMQNIETDPLNNHAFDHFCPERSCEKRASDPRNGGRVQEVTHRHDEHVDNLSGKSQLPASYM